MVEIVNIDFLCPRWITSRFNAVRERWENFKNFQVVHRVRQAREFVRKARELSYNHAMITMFLAVVALLSFLPILAFTSIVSGSFVVIFVTAFTTFQAVVVVSLVPFLAVLVPILMIGGTAAIFVYLAYRSVVKILRLIKQVSRQLTEMINSKVPSRIYEIPIRLSGYKVNHPRYEAFPPTDKERFEEELSYSSPDCI